MSSTAAVDYDVLIVGGGPVGACLGALLARELRTAIRVAIVEPNRPSMPVEGAPLDARVSAFSRASERILLRAGAWERIQQRGVSAYERMRVWHESVAPHTADVLSFDAADVGEPNLGYIIENGVVQAALLDAFEEAGGEIIAGKLESVRINEGNVEINVSGAQTAAQSGAAPVAKRALTASLIIGADGARSMVRELVGLTADIAEYSQTAIVATIQTERPHDNTAWQRFLSNGTIAFLPLADGTSSIVWSTDEAHATELLALSPQDFEHRLAEALDHALGAPKLASDRLTFPLRKLSAHRYVAQRCALIGDAAHVVHPLAGQGVNLGLLDAAALAEVVVASRAEREDPGALRVLRRYERWRKTENELMSLTIDGFNRFLAHGATPLARFAQRGLGWVNRSALLKSFFVNRAMGTSGELPRAARR